MQILFAKHLRAAIEVRKTKTNVNVEAKRDLHFDFQFIDEVFSVSLPHLLSIALDNYKEVSFLVPKKSEVKRNVFLLNSSRKLTCLYYIKISIFINLACWY